MYSLVKAIKALSDNTRLRVINILLERECCVCEVMQALDISQTRASRNLAILYDAGFLQLRKEGLWSLYSLNNNSLEYICKLVEAVKLALANDKDAVKDKKRLSKATRAGFSCSQKAK